MRIYHITRQKDYEILTAEISKAGGGIALLTPPLINLYTGISCHCH